MSEKINNPEQRSSGEKKELNESSARDQKEKLKQTIESGQEAENSAKNSIDKIRSSIDNEAKKQELNRESSSDKDRGESSGPVFVNRKMKNNAYKKEITRVQANLKGTEKAFSKLIHNESIESISNLGSKTIARPSGLLGGGLLALLGSSAYLWVSKHYGYEYNFFLFIALLVVGYFVGIILELLVRMVFGKLRH